jgi:hypothetical protein
MPARKDRRFNRRAFDHIGALDLGDGSASMFCEVLDISEGGARLRLLMCTPDLLPNYFTLLLSSSGRVRRRCRVAWRQSDELGVQFTKD